ncbi:MAG: hypothetical protein OK454_08595 [Thaumarchaeota archaeon]|nr:hypothetical protein [Nitrososphaerota archaeon]
MLSLPRPSPVTRPPHLTSNVQTGRPLALLFSPSEAERTRLAQALVDVALTYKGHINFATADATKLAFLAQPMGLTPGKWPGFAIHTGDEDAEPMAFDQSQDITAEAVARFIRLSLPEIARAASPARTPARTPAATVAMTSSAGLDVPEKEL